MNPVMINLGYINITWYAFLIVFSLFIGLCIVVKNQRIKEITNKNNDLIYDYFFYLIIFAFLGARTWYVIFNFKYYVANLVEIPLVWQGGLAIHGGLLGGLIYTYYFCKKNKVNLLVLTDAMIPALMIGQSIGRFGNFVNQEAYGPQTTLTFLQSTLHLPKFIIEGMNINGVYYHPTFLYESIGNIIGLLILLILYKLGFKKIGIATGFYLIWYGVLRALIEQMRLDALYFGPIRIAQFTSFIMVILGLMLIIWINKKRTDEYK